MDDNDLIEQNHDFIVTETTIKRNVSAEKLIELLKARKTTGELCFDFAKGGIRKIRLSESTKANEEQRDEIRKIVGFD